jgi:hypothetical protein
MSGRQPIVKIIAKSLSQHDKKHFVPTPLSGIRAEKRKEYIFLGKSLTKPPVSTVPLIT